VSVAPALLSLRAAFAPSLGEVIERQEGFLQFPAHGRESISVPGNEFDEARLPQLREPRLKHRGRSLIAGGAQGALVWYCYAPPGCPEPRPRLGSFCSPRGQICDYGYCTGGTSQLCTLIAGWIQFYPPCP